MGTINKEEKFHAMKLCFSDSNINIYAPFNPHILFATLGVAKYGIENHNLYDVFRAKFPPYCDDIIQEEGVE